ncbi:ensconsin-like isoform X1 [Oryzias latipes]|uniref:ensconsin-like isoform X1 n=1 Tax=Oryzias latipes TaxID=8090 RepID=UPI0009DB2FE7|nr:ensconsin-like isoform X1 [Oryzias latipes]
MVMLKKLELHHREPRRQEPSRTGTTDDRPLEFDKEDCPLFYMSIQTPSSVSARPAAGVGLKVDERLRAARERREEQQRLLASRELSWVEREQRARRFYQQQLQERKKKLLEQRLKEERRRAAVEEKRRQKLKEDKITDSRELKQSDAFFCMKERYESAVRKTLEKSQKARHPPDQDWRGRKSKKYVSGHSMIPATTPIHKHLDCRPPMSSPHPPQRLTCGGQTKAAQRPAPQKKTPSMKDMKTASNNHRTPSSAPQEHPPQVWTRRPRPLLQLHPVPKGEPARPVVRPDKIQLLRLKTENSPVSPSPDPPMLQREVSAVRAETLQAPPQPPLAMPLPSTSDREDVSHHLAAKRREARLQPEEDNRRLEAQQEDLHLLEENRRKEKEEQKRAEGKRVQALKEADLLEKQRQEELAKDRARKEKIQQEDAERKARKKRLEEIMRRTRGADPADTAERRPKENTEPPHKGSFEDAVKLPVGARTLQIGLEMVPTRGLNRGEDTLSSVAFKECRSLPALSGLEEIQTHQRVGGSGCLLSKSLVA